MCKYATWFWLNQETGERKPYSCGSWNCPTHQAQVAYKWATKLARAKPERMVTLTNIPQDKTHAYHAFQQLIRDIRAKGIAFEYCRFMEVGVKTGMHHFHLGQKGDYIPKHFLSARAEANGLGKITDVRRCTGKGPAWYLAKYVTKEGVPVGWRKVAASRHFFAVEEPWESDGTWTLVQGTKPQYANPGLVWEPVATVGELTSGELVLVLLVGLWVWWFTGSNQELLEVGTVGYHEG